MFDGKGYRHATDKTVHGVKLEKVKSFRYCELSFQMRLKLEAD